MADKKKARLQDAEVADPEGESWHRKAQEEYERASKPKARKPYEPPPLPEWTASEHVKRELYGRFLQDRDTGIVHDVTKATPECRVDAIVNGTFFHFWSEVLANADVEKDLPCPNCLAV